MQEKTLKLTVLNTRPQAQADIFSELIRKRGGVCIELPCIDIKPVVNQAGFKASFNELVKADYVVFMSANAVYSLVKADSKIVNELDQRACRIVAIGAGTQKALLECGCETDLVPVQFSSQGLLEMPELKDVASKKINILCGENPNKDLHLGLELRGAQVTSVYCYKRCQPCFTQIQFDAINLASLDVVVATSLDVLTHLHSGILQFNKPELMDKPLLVVSTKMQAYAESIPWRGAIIKSQPGSLHIVDALFEWQQG